MKPLNRRRFLKSTTIAIGGTSAGLVPFTIKKVAAITKTGMATYYSLPKGLSRSEDIANGQEFVINFQRSASEGYIPKIDLEGLTSGNLTARQGDPIDLGNNEYKVPVYFSTGDSETIDTVVAKTTQVPATSANRPIKKDIPLRYSSNGSNIDVNFSLDTEYDRVNLSLIDVLGKGPMISENVRGQHGLNSVTLNAPDMPTSQYMLVLTTPEGRQTIKYTPGINSSKGNFDSSNRLKSASSANEDEELQIEVGGYSSKDVDHMLGQFVVSSQSNAKVPRVQLVDSEGNSNWEILDYSDNFDALGGVIRSGDNVYLQGVIPDNTDFINKEFWLKYFMPTGPNAGIEGTVSQRSDRYDLTMRVFYDDGSPHEDIKIPTSVAVQIYGGESGFAPDNVTFREDPLVYDAGNNPEKIDRFSRNIHGITSNPLHAEKRAWLKNMNDEIYPDGNGGLIRSWQEKIDKLDGASLRTVTGTSGPKIGKLGLFMKDHYSG